MAANYSIFSNDWIDLIFDDRNKEYGAYDLRQKYSRNIGLAMLIAIGLIAAGVSAPFISRMISGWTDDANKIKMTEVTTLEAPPPMDKTQPPPPDVPPPPPLKTTVKFVAPVVVEDTKVNEEPPPSVEELKEVEVGKKTQEGDANGVDQSLIETPVVAEETKPFTFVEQMPSFPGGEEALYTYLTKNIRYPEIAKENGITGTVYLKFVVKADGVISGIEVVRTPGGGLEQEAIRVVKTMPSWKPGKQNGKAVPVYFTLPVRFTLR